MSKLLKSAFVVLLVLQSLQAVAFDAPAYFDKKCSSCHNIGGGDDVGPDLKGVSERRSEKWLIDFIRDSAKVISSGDPVANELFAKFKNKKMAAQDLTDDEIKYILAFIKLGKAAGGDSTFRPATEANSYDIEIGKNLFLGVTKFEKGGPSCISCHGGGDGIPFLGGGSLGPDLVKTSYPDYKDKGLNKVLAKIGFPTMEAVYEPSPLTEKENYHLRAFLLSENTNYEKNKDSAPAHGDSRNKFLLLGLVVAFIGLLIMDAVWRKRRKKTKRPY